MFSEKFEQLLKAIPATLVAMALIIGFTVFTQPVHASTPQLHCQKPIFTRILSQGDVWDSNQDPKSQGAVYGFRASGYGDYCTWQAKVNNYHDTLSFDDLGVSQSVVLFETPNAPAMVSLNNGCREPLTLEVCPLFEF
ncbi:MULTISPECIES: hypothetical protein [Moorena]|uniref:Uncharacterized protein n=1 Tax=Moorena producens 3L TaxID=489825 RepID=F4XSY9_9CYAN|nr:MULTISPECIES: hypothetical protein [Moorena]EGJ32329.1 hypothetical protein LYNGBM3L_26550 [Moorena producens 3L]NEP36118.1 hypothetical protein [Moorena sp. SIO3B2]NEP65929.1 hypothetical protein [Moorena sp. SIO3A5]NEQ07781.1 hypothetical protein [Moorena sp. SIO4E2]OLT67457.1 hypothetical protein BI334_22695 [Moorena producens 3L]